jgi:hypothetical protein
VSDVPGKHFPDGSQHVLHWPGHGGDGGCGGDAHARFRHAVPIFVQSVHAAPLAPQAFGFDPTKHCEPEQQPVQLA